MMFFPKGVRMVFMSATLANAIEFTVIFLCRGSKVLRGCMGHL